MARPKIEEFRKQHPHCCFCGGNEETETRDEVPPRSMFLEKVWPEGYQFPACKKCNQGSRLQDQLLALISRISVLDQHQEPIQSQIIAINNNQPQNLPRTTNSSIEAKKLLRALGISKPAGTFAADYPVALVPAETMREIDLVCLKLFCALYYMHVGKIVPRSSRVAILTTTNQILDLEDPFGWQMHETLVNRPRIARGTKDLTDQFNYRWGLEPATGDFACSFHLRMSVFGMMIGPLNDHNAEQLPKDILYVVS